MFKFTETGGLHIAFNNNYKVYIKYPIDYSSLKSGTAAEQIYKIKNSVHESIEFIEVEIKDPRNKDITKVVIEETLVSPEELGGILIIVQNLK